jgi:YfiH family protein
MMRAVPEAEGVLQLELLSAVPGVRHGFPTRRGRLQDVVAGPIARLRQVHGADVRLLPAAEAERAPFFAAEIGARPAADALITDQPGAAVAVAVADCMPVLIADPVHRVVAAAHAGWRGLAAGVIENTVAELRQRYGSDAGDLVVGIGPSIGPCCFEVGPEVIEAFAARGYQAEARPSGTDRGRPHAALGKVAAAILERLGVPEAQVADAALCTRCHSEWLWSYRKDGDAAGRMLCGISID